MSEQAVNSSSQTSSVENSKFATPPQPKRARITNASLHPAARLSSNLAPKSIQLPKLDYQAFQTAFADDANFRSLSLARRDAILSIFGCNAQFFPCLCCVSEETKITDDVICECQAQDCVNNTLVKCTDALSSKTPNLARSHVRDNYKALCENHLARLRLHQCCPGCGYFCIKGRFNRCRETIDPHYFHLTCANEKGQCPHCLATDFAPVEIDLTLVDSETGLPSARMTSLSPLPQGIRRLLNMHNELAVRRHTHRLPGAEKEICIADLADPADREAIRKAISEIDLSVQANLETLEQAMTGGDLRLLLSLLAKNVDPDSRLSNDLTLLQYAASAGQFLICFVLISIGATVDVEEPESGRTALMMAASNCHQGIFKMLVQYGKVNISQKDRSNDTPLHLAAKAGSAEIVRFLIYGANLPSVDDQDYGGWTALMWAAENGQTETVAVLLQAGAKTGTIDGEGNIALHWAAMSGTVEVGRMLLQHNCSEQVNKQNSLGYTPLMIACRENHKGFIELLLANGADPTIEDSEHKTAETYLRNHALLEDDPRILLIQLMHKLSSASVANRNRNKTGLICGDLSKGRERVRINVFNEVDSETVDGFVYISSPLETSPDTKVDRHIDPDASCCACPVECGFDDCGSNGCVCASGMGKVWYDKSARLAPDFPYGTEQQPQYLFECNALCRCSATCRNRVVQRGISVSLKLVRTHDKGWGVFADEDIPKGTFICEYAGELITDRDAEQRHEDVYLFELIDMTLPNAKQISNWLCIDSCKFGNISRFINHGCEFNLFPIKVFYDHVDPRAPHVAFFAAKDIRKNEELTSDDVE